jgi:hypothetical protein
MPHCTALVTVLAILFYFQTSVRVAARGKYGGPAPATSGNPDARMDADLPAVALAVRRLS